MTTRSASELFVVDSSGWLEYLTDDSKASAFGHYLEAESSVLVPSLVIFEVYKHLAKHRARPVADRFMSQALHHRVVAFDETVALAAATGPRGGAAGHVPGESTRRGEADRFRRGRPTAAGA